ncbi:MAG TPA: MarR family transcriptional regulator [Alphaproteobacteria bacterium]|nr:MarR family transcriptional regulator [Alphaproteobacteria bacterium]
MAVAESGAAPDAVSFGMLDELIGYAVRRAQIRIYDDFFRSVADPAITPQRFAVLVLIGSNPGISQARLGQAMGIARSGVNLLVDWLQRSGYAERRRRADDRRSHGLVLSRSGRRKLAELEDVVRRHDRWIARRLGPERLTALREGLSELGVGEE